jgi:hypothetical protein
VARGLYNLQRYTVFPRGGHFSPLERTDDVAVDVVEFDRALEQAPYRP